MKHIYCIGLQQYHRVCPLREVRDKGNIRAISRIHTASGFIYVTNGFFLKLKFQCNVISFDFGYVMVHDQKNLTSSLGQQHLVSD